MASFDCGSKYVKAATIFQFQSATKLYSRQREIANGNIGLRYSSQCPTQFSLIHTGNGTYNELFSRKLFNGDGRHIQVRVYINLLSPETQSYGSKAPCFHYRRIRNQQIPARHGHVVTQRHRHTINCRTAEYRLIIGTEKT